MASTLSDQYLASISIWICLEGMQPSKASENKCKRFRNGIAPVFCFLSLRLWTIGIIGLANGWICSQRMEWIRTQVLHFRAGLDLYRAVTTNREWIGESESSEGNWRSRDFPRLRINIHMSE